METTYPSSHSSIKDLVMLGFGHQFANDEIAATNRAEIAVTKEVSDARSAIESTSAENRLATAIASGEGRLSTALASGEIRAASERNFGEIRNQVSTGFGATNVAIEKTAAATALAIEKTATANALGQKDILLEICKSENRLATQIAECCCEARLDAAATRALIVSEGNRVLERENSDLRLKNLFLSEKK